MYEAPSDQKLGPTHQDCRPSTPVLRHGVQDTLYLHCSPSFASLWLMPRIARFTE